MNALTNDNNIKIYCIYYDKSHIIDYNLQETDIIKLFNTKKKIKQDNINYLSKFFCELSAYYYVWKNNIKSDYVGFCHYRRNFHKIYYDWLDNNNVQAFYTNCYDTYNNSLFKDYLKEKYNITDDFYMMTYKHMYIMPWNIFDKVCECIFGFYDWIYDNYGLNWKDEEDLYSIMELLYDTKMFNEWPCFLAVFNEFAISYFINKITQVKVFDNTINTAILYKTDNKDNLFNIYKKNLKTGCRLIYNIGNIIATDDEIESHHIRIIDDYNTDDILDYVNSDNLIVNFNNIEPNTFIYDMKKHNIDVLSLKENEYITCDDYSQFNNLKIVKNK